MRVSVRPSRLCFPFRLDWNHDGVVSYREFEDFVSLDVSEIASKVKSARCAVVQKGFLVIQFCSSR